MCVVRNDVLSWNMPIVHLRLLIGCGGDTYDDSIGPRPLNMEGHEDPACHHMTLF